MPDFCHRGGWLKKMLDFYLLIGLVDENFINEALPGPRRRSINQPAFVPKGVVERGLEDSKPRKGLLKEACKDQTSEADVERGLEFTIHVGCCLNKRMVLVSFRTPFRSQGHGNVPNG